MERFRINMHINIEYFREILVKFAENSDVNQRHSAAIIKGDKILNIGFNKYCRFAKQNTIHAEMDVLLSLKKKCKHQIKSVDIIIIRISNFNSSTLKNSRPCNHCIEYLQKYPIRNVYYSNEYGDIVCEKLKNMEKKHVSSGHRMHY